MGNGHQCSIVWHIDDLKTSHHVESVVNDIIRKLNAEFGQCDNLSESKFRIHDYLGMKLDYTVPRTLKVSMINYIDTILDDCLDGMDRTAVTPAASHLFKVNDMNPEYLSVKDAEAFCHSTMQLAYLAHHAHLDIRTAITFLQTRVQCPDQDDLKKLLQVIKYLQWTRSLELTLSIDPAMKLTWWVDASYAVHSNMKGLVAWEVLLDPEDCEDEPTQEQQSEIQNQLEQPLALYAASTDPDDCTCMKHLSGKPTRIS